jgi:hypothetical protein
LRQWNGREISGIFNAIGITNDYSQELKPQSLSLKIS